MATAVAPPLPSKGSFTSPSVDPLYSQALAEAQAALQAQTQPLQGQIAGNDAQTSANQTAALANAQAVAKLLSSIAPMISGVYSNAARDQGVLGKGFSTDMQQAVDASGDNVNAMLAKINAPPGQMIDPSKAANAADVLYGLGGYIPGKSFAEQGAAYAGAAAMLPAEAIAQGAENSQQAFNAGQAIDASLNAKIAELAGKLPGDAETNYQHLQTLALENKKFAETVRNDSANHVLKVAAAKLAAAKYNTGIDEFNARQKLAYAKYGTSVQEFNARQAMTAQKFARQQFQQNRMYSLSLQRLGISERGLQLRVAASAFKQAHGGYTASQVARFNQKLDALESAGKATHPVNGVMPTPGFFDKNGKAIKVNPATGLPASKPFSSQNVNTYANFIKEALRKGVPIQLTIQRANTIWPETERGDLGALGQLPEVAAQAAQQSKDYQQMTGQTLGTSPNGVAIRWAAPANMSAQGKKVVSGVLSLAQEYLGTPYAWGGDSPTGFDCSGLAQYIYAKEGITIPRTTYDQFQSGLAVPKGQLQAGDLVFFKGSDSRGGLPGHVGIFIGNNRFIEAPHTGDVVKVSTLSGYPGYQGARRFVR